MIETSFPVYQATNEVGSDDSAVLQTASLAPALGKGQAD